MWHVDGKGVRLFSKYYGGVRSCDEERTGESGEDGAGPGGNIEL